MCGSPVRDAQRGFHDQTQSIRHEPVLERCAREVVLEHVDERGDGSELLVR